MPAITTLFLDVGGVLATNGWDRHMRERAAAAFQLDYTDMDDRHRETFDTYEQGKLTLDEYLTRVVFYRERPFSREQFIAFMFDQSQPYPPMLELVRGLKARHGLRLALVNNEGRELNEHRIRKFGLRAFVDCFLSSCYVHFRKPDADLYRLALDVMQAAPEEVAYLDDRAMFVDVARGLGIHGIHHTGYDTTRSALAGLGLPLS